MIEIRVSLAFYSSLLGSGKDPLFKWQDVVDKLEVSGLELGRVDPGMQWYIYTYIITYTYTIIQLDIICNELKNSTNQLNIIYTYIYIYTISLYVYIYIYYIYIHNI